MPRNAPPSEPSGRPDRGAVTMAVVFGLLSVPWTFGFEQVAGLPLWPSFIASASFLAAGGGRVGFGRSLAGNLTGGAYATLTLAVVALLDGGVLTLSVVVGAFMFLASLHALVPVPSFTPAAFFGYAVVFSVHAAGVQLGMAGLAGELVASAASLGIGAGIGWLAEGLTEAWMGRAVDAPA